eukprot:scaffold124140_cov33-Tisochrysis_lutea.AAC.2
MVVSTGLERMLVSNPGVLRLDHPTTRMLEADHSALSYRATWPTTRGPAMVSSRRGGSQIWAAHADAVVMLPHLSESQAIDGFAVSQQRANDGRHVESRRALAARLHRCCWVISQQD